MSTQPQEFENIASRLGILDFDLLLVGDGSGTTVDSSCGWFTTLYDRTSRTVTEHFGCANHGTNNLAELAPYVFSLWYYHTKTFGQTDEQKKRPKVAIVSDSELTVRCGNGVYSRKANGCVWAAIDWFSQSGYEISWFHVPRNSNAFSDKADSIASLSRKMIDTLAGGSNEVPDNDEDVCHRVADKRQRRRSRNKTKRTDKD